jgi:hypothetical protein
MGVVVIGEDGDVFRVEDVVAVTFGDRRRYQNEVEVRFWFRQGFYLDYVDITEEEKERIRSFFIEPGVACIKVGGKRKKS